METQLRPLHKCARNKWILITPYRFLLLLWAEELFQWISQDSCRRSNAASMAFGTSIEVPASKFYWNGLSGVAVRYHRKRTNIYPLHLPPLIPFHTSMLLSQPHKDPMDALLLLAHFPSVSSPWFFWNSPHCWELQGQGKTSSCEICQIWIHHLKVLQELCTTWFTSKCSWAWCGALVLFAVRRGGLGEYRSRFRPQYKTFKQILGLIYCSTPRTFLA